MRRISHAGGDEESQVDLTPLIDVVFIMLIFFIVTATFIKETGIDVNKPDAPTSTQQNKANILIAIDARDGIWIDRRKIDIRSVIPNIKRLRSENPQGTVVIQADKESRNKTLVEVMDAARQAGEYNIALAANK
ncbi:MAG: biopolymer transport protein ExbD [Planctomycetota bacterium]|jgi:biopolymer transport protein ExbD